MKTERKPGPYDVNDRHMNICFVVTDAGAEIYVHDEPTTVHGLIKLRSWIDKALAWHDSKARAKGGR